MVSPNLPRLTRRQIFFRRPITHDQIVEVLRLWAHDPRRSFVVVECRIARGEVSYVVGAPDKGIDSYAQVLSSTMRGSQVLDTEVDRVPMSSALRVSVRGIDRPLRRDHVETTIRAALAAASHQHDGLVVQLILGDRRPAAPVSSTRQSPTTDADHRTAMRQKNAEPAFGCVIRLGSTNPATLSMMGLYQALGTLEDAGVRFHVRRESPRQLNEVRVPWRWSQYLNIAELAALTLWPVGDDDLPGLGGLHPVKLPPAVTAKKPEYVVAQATAPGPNRVIGLDTTASLRHLWITGPPGVGKSVLLVRLVLQDIVSGKGAVLIEPKGDAIAEVLSRVPAHRRDDVVILDPTDAHPVGLNPLAGGHPDVRTEGLLEIFESLFGDAIGPRSRDVLHNSLLTLARRGDASLPMLPLLLTNPGFRRSITQQAIKDDPIALAPFWSWYEHLSDSERSAVIAPVLNKVRIFTINRQLRGVLGQRRPAFNLRQVFDENKILLVPLQAGIIGDAAAKLLGSLVVAELWQTILGRVAVPERQRRPVIVTIDELHQYVHARDLGEMLALSRGYGTGFRLANQHLAQLPRNLREAMLGTVRSRVVFQTNHRDAAELAKGHREISAEDFTSLGAYEVYASLMDGNTATPYVSGRTVDLPPVLHDGQSLREHSRQRFGRPLDEVEVDLADMIADPTVSAPTVSGRRRRQS